MVDYTRLKQFGLDSNLTITQIKELVSIVGDIQAQVLHEFANTLTTHNLMKMISKK